MIFLFPANKYNSFEWSMNVLARFYQKLQLLPEDTVEIVYKIMQRLYFRHLYCYTHVLYQFLRTFNLQHKNNPNKLISYL